MAACSWTFFWIRRNIIGQSVLRDPSYALVSWAAWLHCPEHATCVVSSLQPGRGGGGGVGGDKLLSPSSWWGS